MSTQDFLLELGTEELPPKLLKQLSNALTNNVTTQLSGLNLSYTKVMSFATPRRLAVLVSDLQLQQEDQLIERKGPAVSAPIKRLKVLQNHAVLVKLTYNKKLLAKQILLLYQRAKRLKNTRFITRDC